MKNIFTRNIGLKLLSIVLALLLWLTIMNFEDPSITKTIEGIPVQVINEEVVTSRGYLYAIESGEKVDVKVKGRRSILDNLKVGDFVATADFTLFNSMYYAPIDVKCVHADADELTVTPKNDQMAIKLEDQATVPANINVVLNGNVKEGYYLFGYETDTGLVQATGAASQVARVKNVVAEVDIDNVLSSFEIDATLYALDDNDERIDSKKISLSPDTVKVKVTICPIKSLELDVTTTGEPDHLHYVDKLDFATKTIDVAADAEILSKLDKLKVECDVSGATQDVENQVNLESLIEKEFGDRCKVVDPTKTMSVIVKIKKLQEKKLEVKADDVVIKGTDADAFEYTIYSLWNANVTIRGREGELDNMEISDLDLYVDATGLEAGTQSVQLKSDYNGDVQLELGSVSIIIEKKQQAPPQNMNIPPVTEIN